MIYFVKRPEDGRIKIGTTIRLSERLKQLVSEHGEGLEILAVVEGSYQQERELYRRFAWLRAMGEWFEPGDDLIGFIVAEGRKWDGSDEVTIPLSVKLHLDVIETARIVAAYRNETMTDMLSEILRPILARMETEEVARRTKAPMSKGGPR